MSKPILTHTVTSNVGDMVDIDIGKDTDMDKAGNYNTVADND